MKMASAPRSRPQRASLELGGLGLEHFHELAADDLALSFRIARAL